jgi:hypothetical protein
MTTTASLIVTADPEATLGLTCSACIDPATHTVDVQQGTGTNVETSVTYYLCQVDVVRVLAEDLTNRGAVVAALNPNTWS